MRISDDVLMAYADGEADAETRAAIEAAMRDDPEIGRRIAEHRALRAVMQGAFSPILDEPVPQRLIDAAHGNAAFAGKVVELARARPGGAASGRSRSWQPFAVAASLLIGLALGYLGWHGTGGLMKVGAGGELVAAADLAEALSTQLSADRSAARVATTGLSFRAKSGDYCRTFSLIGKDASSGLACHEGNDWKIKVLAQASQAAPDAPNYRPAASADIPAVRAAVEESIDGEALDRAGEIAARLHGWAKAPAH